MTSNAYPLAELQQTPAPYRSMPAGYTPAPVVQQKGGVGAMPTTLTSYKDMPLQDQYDLAIKNPVEFMRILETIPYRKDRVDLSQSYKTQLCPSFFKRSFKCSGESNCAFAMSLFEQVRYCTARHFLWKTKVCEHIRAGTRCTFKVCLAGHPGSLMRNMEKIVDLTTKRSWLRCTGFYILDDEAVKAGNQQFPVRYINPPPVRAAYVPTPAPVYSPQQQRAAPQGYYQFSRTFPLNQLPIPRPVYAAPQPSAQPAVTLPAAPSYPPKRSLSPVVEEESDQDPESIPDAQRTQPELRPAEILTHSRMENGPSSDGKRVAV